MSRINKNIISQEMFSVIEKFDGFRAVPLIVGAIVIDEENIYMTDSTVADMKAGYEVEHLIHEDDIFYTYEEALAEADRRNEEYES